MLDKHFIRRRRQELRLSQEQLGKLIKQDQAYVSTVEIGRRPSCTITTLTALAEALKCTTDELLGRKPLRFRFMPVEEKNHG